MPRIGSRRHSRTVTVAFVLGAATAIGLAVPLAASASLQLQTFSQSAIYTPDSPVAVSAVKAKCPTKTVRGIEPVSTALAQATALVKRGASRTALAKLARTSAAHDPRLAGVMAGAALLDKRPLAALAVLLDALRRRPGDVQTLVSVSALLSRLQMPRQALAVLARIRRIPRAPTSMGIPLRAMLLNNQGLALLELGRYSDAEKTFRAALKAGPLLAVAQQNLSDARICSGAAATVGVPWPPPDPPLPPDDPPIEQAGSESLPPDQIFDLSQGVDGTLPSVNYPQNPQQGADAVVSFQQQADDAFAHATQDQKQADQLLDQELASRPSPLTLSRTNQILFDLAPGNPEAQDPELKGLQSAIDATRPTVDRVIEEWNQDFAADGNACAGSSDPDCVSRLCAPQMAGRHTEWLAAMHVWDNAWAKYFRAKYHYMTGLAANLADPRAHQAAMLIAQASREAFFQDLNLQSSRWLAEESFRDECRTSPEPVPSTDDPDGANSAACPKALNAMDVSIKVDEVKVAVNCEKFDIEVGTPGPIGLFGQQSINLRTGQETIYFGVKAGASLPGGFSAGVQTGVYVQVGADGSAEDAGWRVSPSLSSPGPGGSSISASDSMDFSFAGGF
jgi:tetratricopeptide (TPR) repeat protein